MQAPTWDQYMAPTLRLLQDGEIHRGRDLVSSAADLLGVTDEQRAIMIPSGQNQWVNRGNWALSYLSRAAAVERPSRAHYRITEVGQKLLAEHPHGIVEKDLRTLPGYSKRAASPQSSDPVDDSSELDTVLDPREQVEAGIARINADVADQLLSRILDQDPYFFEQAVLDLLMAMGYGGAEGRARRTQLARDGGIDGIVDQDALGLSRIYVQAKRYAADNIIGRPTLQAFFGALAGNRANQGVFITTSRFSQDARSYAEDSATRMVLIDGEQLTRLMIRYGVGVQVQQTIQIVEIDEDFFE